MMKAISEFCILLRNGKSVRQSSVPSGLPITRIETIADGTIDPTRVGFANLLESDSSDWLLQEGDILISHINSTKHLGKCAIYRGEPPALVHGMNLLLLRVDKNQTNSSYVYRLLSSPGFRSQLPRITKNSVNQSSFNISSFKNLQIPLPPLPEQKRIAAILDAADALRAKRRESLALLDTLLQSTFLDMFGDPVTNPKGWKVIKLKEISTHIVNGTTPKGGQQVYSEEGIVFFRSQNVWRNALLFDDVVYIDNKTHQKMKKSSLKNKDILMTKTGRINTENSSLGRAAIFLGEDDSANINGHVYLIRLQKNTIHRFILYILTTNEYKEHIRRVCVGAIDKRQINKEHLEEFPIISPPLDLQLKFASIVETIERQKVLQRAHLTELDKLFASLQQRAFAGEL